MSMSLSSTSEKVVAVAAADTMTAVVPVAKNLEGILQRIKSCQQLQQQSCSPPRLIAVSKTKPIPMILEAYKAGQRDFGENYANELHAKSHDPLILDKCPDIRWHYIGTCQTSSANKLLKTLNLEVIQTVTGEKLAGKFQSTTHRDRKDKTLNVMVQINTSGEGSKSGVEPENAAQLVRYIVDQCPNLKIIGVMTIGALGNSLAKTEDHAPGRNPDFLKLIALRKEVAEILGVEEHSLELSMGMSNDFEEAIKMGSTNVRVGSSIFGARSYPAPSKTPPPSSPESKAKGVKQIEEQLKDNKI